MSQETTKGERRVATIGMFDGVHLGHQLVVSQVCDIGRRIGLKPTVFSFDCHPMTVIAPDKAPRQLSSLANRAQWLVNAGADEVIYLPFAEIRQLSAADFMRLLNKKYGVEVLVVGFNHHFGRGGKGTFDDYLRIGAERGIQVVKADEYIDPLIGVSVSSSSIRLALSSGKVELANNLLGRPYAIPGIVTHGRNIGQSLGFPTANLKPFLSHAQLPACGVYAAFAVTAQSRVPAMVNIGNNPTVADDSPLTIEAHLIDYTGDLYGSVMTVEFIARLRNEQKFDSLQALSSQLQLDKDSALRLLS